MAEEHHSTHKESHEHDPENEHGHGEGGGGGDGGDQGKNRDKDQGKDKNAGDAGEQTAKKAGSLDDDDNPFLDGNDNNDDNDNNAGHDNNDNNNSATTIHYGVLPVNDPDYVIGNFGQGIGEEHTVAQAAQEAVAAMAEQASESGDEDSQGEDDSDSGGDAPLPWAGLELDEPDIEAGKSFCGKHWGKLVVGGVLLTAIAAIAAYFALGHDDAGDQEDDAGKGGDQAGKGDDDQDKAEKPRLTLRTMAATDAIVGSAYRYDIQVTAEPAAKIAIAATKKPDWLTLTDNGDGTATLTGSPTAAGTDQVTIEATAEGADKVVETFAIVVVDKLVIASKPVTEVVAGARYLYQIGVRGVGDDTLSVSVDGALPDWLALNKIDAGDGPPRYVLTGIPDASLAGAAPVQVALTATAGTRTARQTLSIGVRPAIATEGDTGFTSFPLLIAVAGKRYGFKVETVVADGNDAKPRIEAITAPDWLTFKDNGDGSGLLQGTPPADALRFNTVQLAMNAGNSGASMTYTLEVRDRARSWDEVLADAQLTQAMQQCFARVAGEQESTFWSDLVDSVKDGTADCVSAEGEPAKQMPYTVQIQLARLYRGIASFGDAVSTDRRGDANRLRAAVSPPFPFGPPEDGRFDREAWPLWEQAGKLQQQDGQPLARWDKLTALLRCLRTYLGVQQ